MHQERQLPGSFFGFEGMTKGCDPFMAPPKKNEPGGLKFCRVEKRAYFCYKKSATKKQRNDD
jgi:hypothetical protein